jgi:site-specific DNA-methyltransferase (adenine-specific)
MLTKRQKEVLDFIKESSKKKGYAPSLEEIQRHFKLASVSTAHFHVTKLRDGGYLDKSENRARAISVAVRGAGIKIPLLGTIAAGKPIEAIENKEMIEVDKALLSKGGSHYALKVSGNSMIDEGIFDGDTVIVREQQVAENGEKVVALVNGNEATLKKFYFENNRVRLQPANPSFPPIFPDEIMIQGKVIGLISNKNEPQEIDKTHPKEKLEYVSDGISTIFHGDSLKVLKNIKDESVDLVFADPPYNLGKDFGNNSDKWDSVTKYLEWCQEWINECIRILKPDGTFYFMNATQHMPYLDVYVSSKLKIVNRIIWSYDSSGVQAKNKFGSLYEPILMAVKDDQKYKFNYEDIQVEAKTGAKRKLIDYRKKVPTPYNTKKTPGNVWYFPRVRYRMPEYEDHPSQKPEALMERIILASSNPGDVVLDPFAGTFTTCTVARNHGRKTIGIEMSEKYFKIGLRRLNITKEYNGEALVKDIKKKTSNRNKRDHHQLNQLPFLNP